MARGAVSLTRSTAASLPGPTTVFVSTWWSYWRQIQRFDATSAEARSCSRAALASAGPSSQTTPALSEAEGGAGRTARSYVCSSSRPAGLTPSRRYSGASVNTFAGTRPTSSSPSKMRTRPSSVTRPMTSACSSQRRKWARTSDSCSFLATTSIRSCDSLSITSAAVLPAPDVDLDAGVAARRALDERAREAGGAQVLQPDDPVAALLRQLHARLHEQLLQEGVAHLHRRPQLLLALLEGARGEHVGAADTVPGRVGADAGS